MNKVARCAVVDPRHVYEPRPFARQRTYTKHLTTYYRPGLLNVDAPVIVMAGINDVTARCRSFIDCGAAAADSYNR